MLPTEGCIVPAMSLSNELLPALNRGLLDKSTYQLELQFAVAAGQKSMSYQVVDGNEIETYDFRVLGSERVRTKAGLIDAIKEARKA